MLQLLRMPSGQFRRKFFIIGIRNAEDVVGALSLYKQGYFCIMCSTTCVYTTKYLAYFCMVLKNWLDVNESAKIPQFPLTFLSLPKFKKKRFLQKFETICI